MNKLLNVPEVAEILRISPHTLRTWIAKDMIPIVRIGRRILFDEVDIIEFIEKGKEVNNDN